MKIKKKIYLLRRGSQSYYMDEYDGFVVLAANKREAKSLILESVGKENLKKFSCTPIKATGKSKIILDSFLSS